ncbi:hypothetical protein OPT61_g7094 [Boeremia exigua]|uniref:Uncharacterized protein n=1 Tax=Boeremia exigua TaxID=749465 RepID=A0ACC2I4U0_9PLEO|nr:hypothetical protein OPT61_g7094 [Boeremia exigua]
MSAVSSNNAFGVGSPSWNLAFPDGNLTISEILAYLPHWLKSVDVILRIVKNDGRAVTITHLLNKYREMPNTAFQPNSTTVMMQYAMRRTDKSTWTIGSHGKFKYDREYDEDSLYVGDFRPPRLTHPKLVSKKQSLRKEDLARNAPAPPIPFKELARHVKEHPSGNDALDLTRCVKYALEHPDEKWLFPIDFRKLVDHIGGPLVVTYFHLDSQLFKRYDHLHASHKGSRADQVDEDEPETFTDGEISEGEGEDEWGNATEVNHTTDTRERNGSQQLSNKPDGRQPRAFWWPQKEQPLRQESTSLQDTDAPGADPTSLRKKRKTSRLSKDEESDFKVEEEPDSEDALLPVNYEAAGDSNFSTPTAARGQRVASHKARQSINESSDSIMERFRAAAANARPAHPTFHSPEMSAVAEAYGPRVPLFLSPPLLPANRLVIDDFTLPLYAQEGCRNRDEMWASALSTYRFNGGPRTSAPYRELYRLTEPMPWDLSDWAENIRWAKEQYKTFGVKTWAEYDDHLEAITNWRRQSFWVSEECIVMSVSM